MLISKLKCKFMVSTSACLKEFKQFIVLFFLLRTHSSILTTIWVCSAKTLHTCIKSEHELQSFCLKVHLCRGVVVADVLHLIVFFVRCVHTLLN